MNNTRKKWTIEEDTACCNACIDNYVIEHSSMERERFVDKVSSMPQFAGRDKSSVRMRIQNVKALLEEMHIENSLPIRPLANVAKQTRETLKSLLQERGIIQS